NGGRCKFNIGQPDLGIDMHPIEAVNTSFPVADALHIAYVYSASEYGASTHGVTRDASTLRALLLTIA
ncbi:hypothetical protein, partial [Burkholderia sp. SIMBA_048]|uniref:hypothetical protein n=1 Tax=Burkholderia sp. SIMBA_048 TaxID=3085789 RepID=UPI00397B9D95